jgi:hypothetical protein
MKSRLETVAEKPLKNVDCDGNTPYFELLA